MFSCLALSSASRWAISAACALRSASRSASCAMRVAVRLRSSSAFILSSWRDNSMDLDAAIFAAIEKYLSAIFFSQHPDLRALIEPFPRQSHDDRLKLLVAQRHATIMSHTSADEAAFVKLSRAQPETKAIMHQYLHTVGAFVDEQVCM